jgi:hypothetical protein
MNDNKSAFPVFEETRVNENGTPCTDYALEDAGMTLKEYAAIHLKVPRSGDPELDAMIRESVRRDFMEKALTGIAAKVYNTGEYKPPHVWGDIADEARLTADAMLAEWEKEAGK